MDVFGKLSTYDFGEVHFRLDKATQLRAIVAIHDSRLGPALGVRRGIEACVKFKLGKDDLKGVHIAIQGVGHVGYHLCKELHASGAKLTVADVDKLKSERAQREFGAAIVAIDDIPKVECDVFAPCALGAGLNDNTVPFLKARVVAGAANNQLAEPR